MKQKKVYEAPAAEVVEVNLTGSILAASAQAENGTWEDLDEGQDSEKSGLWGNRD